MSDDNDAWMDELVPPGAKLKRHDAEIDRLRAELAEYTKLKEYAKSLGQQTYLELHADNERLRTEVVCLRCEIDWRGEEIKRLRDAVKIVWPYFEGEHYYDHPDCVTVRAILASTTAAADSPVDPE